MSAATALSDLAWTPSASPRSRPRHLRLVVPVQHATPAAGRALRLTRRGRLTVTLAVAALVVALVAGLTGLLPAGAAAPEQVHVVRAGQTLSEVAATTLPQLPLDQAIVQLQLANGLNTVHVQAGQSLVIPQP